MNVKTMNLLLILTFRDSPLGVHLSALEVLRGHRSGVGLDVCNSPLIESPLKNKSRRMMIHALAFC